VERLFHCSDIHYSEAVEEHYGIRHELIARKR